MKYKTWEITASFNSRASFFTGLRKTLKYSSVKFNKISNTLYFENIMMFHDMINIKKDILSLKRLPKNLTVKTKIVEILKEYII